MMKNRCGQGGRDESHPYAFLNFQPKILPHATPLRRNRNPEAMESTDDYPYSLHCGLSYQERGDPGSPRTPRHPSLARNALSSAILTAQLASVYNHFQIKTGQQLS
jgi:hypothetical protein